MSDAKRKQLPCWACGALVDWDRINRVVALREWLPGGKHPEYQFCGDCMRVIDAAQGSAKVR